MLISYFPINSFCPVFPLTRLRYCRCLWEVVITQGSAGILSSAQAALPLSLGEKEEEEEKGVNLQGGCDEMHFMVQFNSSDKKRLK